MAFNPNKDWIYYSGPNMGKEEYDSACDTLYRGIFEGKWIPSGEKVAAFERAFSLRFHQQESLMVNSGSSANLVMLAALKKYYGWPDGSEIIVSPVGFPTTIAPIVQNNLVPRFVDISLDDLNFDLNQVAKAGNDKTVGIFISPVLGNPPDMKKLLEVSYDLGEKVKHILDGCDSLGSKWHGYPLSDYAVATSCSFYPAHHITTGEGGMVSSSIEEVIKIARQFAWWGRDCYCVGRCNLLPNGTCKKRFDDWLGDGTIVDHKYIFTQMGYNLKPLDLQGSIGLEQLKKFDWIHEKRREHNRAISWWFIKHVKGVRTIQEHERAETSWFGVPIICETEELKTKLVAYLEANRIQTRNYFAGNILKHPGYKHLGDFKDYPMANEVLKRVFFIGCHPGYTEEQLNYIEGVISCFREN